MPTSTWCVAVERLFEAVAAPSGTSVIARATATTSDERRSLDTKRFRLSSERVEQAAKSLLEAYLGLPPQYLARPRDVGLAHLGVVDRQRLEDDLAGSARRLDHGLGQLQQRHLLRVADVDRQVLLAFSQRDQSADQVVDVTEAPRLGAVAEHREGLALERLADERRDRAPVVRGPPRAVRVEDPHDAGVHALLTVVGHRQGLGVALRLVVDAARADRVHVAPVGLLLGVDLRVAVDLGGGREQEARALDLREAQGVVRSVRADFERVQGESQVVDRARRARQVVDEVHRLVDRQVLGQVVVDERVAVVPDVLDVREVSRVEVVDTDDPQPLLEKRIAEVGSEKPCPAGDYGSWHGERWYKDAPDEGAPFTEPLPPRPILPTNLTRSVGSWPPARRKRPG